MTDSVSLRRAPSRLGASLLLIAVFGAGAVAGGAFETSHFAGRRPHGPETFIRHLADDLTLTPAQTDSVRAILVRHRPQMDSVWASMTPRFETLRQTIRSEIATQLDAEQRTKFDAFNRREESRRPGHN
ncbi:MAG: periplasmic heavy metal sensor [Gemmatimonadales bacterium]